MRRWLIVAVLLACLSLSSCGGIDVAVVGQLYASHSASYDMQLGIVTAMVTFSADVESYDAVVLGNAPIPSGIPELLPVTLGNGDVVVLHDVARTATRRKVADSLITVQYEGHVDGVANWTIDHGTRAELMTSALVAHATAGNKIGPDGEGTNRLVSQTLMTVTRHYTAVAGWHEYQMSELIYNIIPALSGSVNEKAWGPSFALYDSVWDEGAWQLQSAPITKNRDDSYTVVFTFVSNYAFYPSTQPEMQYYNWYEYKTEPMTVGGLVRQKRTNIAPVIKSQIHPVAGTDISQKFADLDL